MTNYLNLLINITKIFKIVNTTINCIRSRSVQNLLLRSHPILITYLCNIWKSNYYQTGTACLISLKHLMWCLISRLLLTHNFNIKISKHLFIEMKLQQRSEDCEQIYESTEIFKSYHEYSKKISNDDKSISRETLHLYSL